jgi:DhnA family fructose-bisphosphate aldolase class Ia
MTGHWLRLNKLFSGGTCAVIVVLDHGEFRGPVPGMTDLPAAISAVAEADALLLSPGMMAHCGSVFDHRGAPLAIIRLNWSSIYCEQWNYHRARVAQVIGPDEALAMGADLCLASLSLTCLEEDQDARSVEGFSQLASRKRECGIPLIGEFYPAAADRLTEEELHERVLIASRMLAELGADAIKAPYTGERFREVVEGTPVPILAQAVEKLTKDLDALQLAHAATRAGARGVVFGRNVMQAKHPDLLVRALQRVVKEDAVPEDVADELGL